MFLRCYCVLSIGDILNNCCQGYFFGHADHFLSPLGWMSDWQESTTVRPWIFPRRDNISNNVGSVSKKQEIRGLGCKMCKNLALSRKYVKVVVVI